MKRKRHCADSYAKANTQAVSHLPKQLKKPTQRPKLKPNTKGRGGWVKNLKLAPMLCVWLEPKAVMMCWFKSTNFSFRLMKLPEFQNGICTAYSSFIVISARFVRIT